MRTIKGVQVSMRCRRRQELKGCDNKKVIPKEIVDTVYNYTSVRAALEAVRLEHSGVNEKAVIAAEAKLLDISKQMQELSSAILAVGAIPEVLSRLQQAQEAREATEQELAVLKATVVPSAKGWSQQGRVWDLERSDPQRLSAMLRRVGYSITIHVDGRLVSDSGVTYRYAGVDRKTNRYKLVQGDKVFLILKGSDEDYPYWEPFDEVGGETMWSEEDYENLRKQYE